MARSYSGLFRCAYSHAFIAKNALLHSLPHPLPRLLAPRLSSYDNAQRSSQFSQHSYECSVCFNSRKGSRCLLLSCGHIFCRECLEDGWKLYIAEGDVSRVGCLDPSCVKLEEGACTLLPTNPLPCSLLNTLTAAAESTIASMPWLRNVSAVHRPWSW